MGALRREFTTKLPSHEGPDKAFKFGQAKLSQDRASPGTSLRAADLLLESGGFGLIALDLGDLPPQTARRIPLTTWFRFRRAVEHTPTMLLAIERQSIAGSCSSLLIKLGSINWQQEIGNSDQQLDSQFPSPTHAQLLTELEITAEVMRSRLDRKPAGSVRSRSPAKLPGRDENN